MENCEQEPIENDCLLNESETESVVDSSNKMNSKLSKTIEEIQNTGVIYLSRVPEKMTVTALRNIMSEYGEIGRIYLTPDESTRKTKVWTFTEGWIEFKNKKDAKRVARLLNSQQIKGKRKKVPWYNDIWNIRYLPKFKWTHLKEKALYQQAVRRQKLLQEVKMAKKEAEFYAKCIEETKRLKRKGFSFTKPIENKQVKKMKYEIEEVPCSDEMLTKIFG